MYVPFAVTVYKPPNIPEIQGKKVLFLAGTIDNGQSEDWQRQLTQSLNDQDIIILNPRRDDWDVTWEQRFENPLFKAQVEWELDGLEMADVIFMYFAPGSKSPITLLELGLMAQSGKLIIVSPDGFWRRGNVEVVAHRYAIPLCNTMSTGVNQLMRVLSEQ
ncbi:MAG: hypothetical protein GY943_34520 [Chloroflexi bacterium]|nr:hypothetical protein [Chloroflexota bacterium]